MKRTTTVSFIIATFTEFTAGLCDGVRGPVWNLRIFYQLGGVIFVRINSIPIAQAEEGH